MQPNKFPTWMRQDEKEIASGLITAILNRGLKISVYDGGDWPVKQSTDRAAIEADTAQTEMTGYRIRDAAGEYCGFFDLIHGNGRDVVSDYSDNALCDEIWGEIEPLTQKEWVA